MGRRIFTLVAGAVLLFALSACEPTTAPPTQNDVLPPPDPVESSTSSSAPSQTTSTLELSRFTYQGTLPDGSAFTTTIPGQREETLTLVTGAFNRVTGAHPIPVGEVRYTRVTEATDLGYFNGILRMWSEPWLVEVLFSKETRQELALMPDVNVEAAIQLVVVGGLPQVRLLDPFTWAGATPQIRYESFLVASGCWPEAARCVDNHAVQVVSSDLFGGPALSQERIDGMTLETTSSRPVFDPSYLDPGPLSHRNSAQLMWTGEEMIVWGGKEDRDSVPYLIDGASFDPETNQWRMISPIPLGHQTGARAIWADGEMVVVSTDGTFGYNPKSDSWREIGNGLLPSEFHDRILYFEGSIYVWDRSSEIHVMDLATGQWERLAAPPEGSTDPFSGVLRGVNGRVIAVTLADSCDGKQFWVLDRDSWQPLRDASLATAEYGDCSTSNQSASVSNDLFIWDDYDHPTMAYSTFRNEWRELHPIPLDGTEGASGPVAMDANHFMVPRWGEAAIFDATEDGWWYFELPGQGIDAEIVWTGAEFLAWGIWGSFDAWRWAPEDYVFGTGSTTR